MFTANDRLYWLTLGGLHRLTLADGRDDVLAEVPQGAGFFMGLGTDGQDVFFTSSNLPGDGANGELIVREVAP
jgi:hypothetical protein